MRVVGLDLSLRATGFASEEITTVLSCALSGAERLQHLRNAVLAACRGGTNRFENRIGLGVAIAAYEEPRLPWPDLVCIEGYSFGSRNGGERLGELGGVIRLAFHEAGVPWIELSPSVVKKLATGRGNAKKEEVLTAAVRRLDYAGSSTDEADARWLREAALQAFGEPTVVLPAAHLAALKGIEWPAIPALAARAAHPAGAGLS